jgi:hypothetical protein
MYQPILSRFQSRDPMSANGMDLLDDSNWFGQRLTKMRHQFGDGIANGFTDYTYARNNPLTFVDPSGLACRYADPPTNVIPDDDPYFPWQVWRPQPRSGYVLTIGRTRPVTFDGVTCDDCKMDIEIVARSYRYYRFKNNRFIGHEGTPIGVSNDPRDFFGLVVVTVCRSNIECCGEKMPNEREVLVSRPLSKDGVGVFIRNQGGIEPVAARFASDDACGFGIDAVAFIQSNVREGPIDPNQR